MQSNILKILIFLNFFYLMNGYAEIKNSIGEIWPKPRFERKCITKLIDLNNFEFVVVGETCDILAEALIRYTKIIKQSIKSQIINIEEDILESGMVTKVNVNLTRSCEHFPHLEMDESYKIFGTEYIFANSIWGILRGLETYSQAITPTVNGMLNVPNLRIIDSPRFPHRGLLLDTARHYIDVDTILTILDGMAYNKMNVFHWHIVDDQSFPYQSIKFPELSEKGAFEPIFVYTQENICGIIEYARMRGIRVVAEFDMPGHSRSWGSSHPEILTECGPPHSGKFGPLNPISNGTYDFLQKFFSEVRDVFPEKFIHVGGDEIDFECWKSNKEIQSYIKTREITNSDLQNMFMERITKLLTNKSFALIVWQDAINKNVEIPKETIVQVWMDSWKYHINQFTNSGYRVLLSECWYLNYVLPDENWIKFYNCEPRDFDGSTEQKKLVIGGEACMWTEYANSNNVIQTIFPRLSAVAERLWSENENIGIDKVEKRLEEHVCRMKLRGISVPPVTGRGIC